MTLQWTVVNASNGCISILSEDDNKIKREIKLAQYNLLKSVCNGNETSQRFDVKFYKRNRWLYQVT